MIRDDTEDWAEYFSDIYILTTSSKDNEILKKWSTTPGVKCCFNYGKDAIINNINGFV